MSLPSDPPQNRVAMSAASAVSTYDRVSHFLDGVNPKRRTVVTPEGVTLPVELAQVGERAVALAIDVTIQFLAAAAIMLVCFGLFLSQAPLTVIGPLITFTFFVIRVGYFIFFELAWQGATPGKRIVGLRVMDRRGAPLSPIAAVARNLTREIELFLPLGLLSASSEAGASGWMGLCLGLWALLFTLLPLFNRDRLRAGDFVAGTMVVALPKKRLLQDLVESDFHYHFSNTQLAAYGAFELQVLEELLRRPVTAETTRLRIEVAGKIARKIGWSDPIRDANVDLFLVDFYTAERAFLEREQLYGRHHPGKG